MKRVYLDHNATTPMRPEARELFLETLDLVGNPSSVHASGRRARQVLDAARERVAGALAVHEDEVVFTSGGTEANNLAVLGVVRAAGPGAGLVTTTVEHSSVLEPARTLAAAGHPVGWAPVDAEGRPRTREVLELAGAPECALVSVMTANNEVGALGPVSELAAGLAAAGARTRPRLHTDAVQALGKMALDLAGWGVDLASLSAHKVGGPQGVGVLFRRRGVAMVGLQYGGGQESELRPGTENVPGIAASSLAIALAVGDQKEYADRTRRLATTLWGEVRRVLPDARLLGPPLESSARIPNTLNILLPDVDGRVLVTRLDLAGLEVSAGSACASGSLEPSHVLLAMGLDEERARAGLRLSLGRTTTDEDIHTAVEALRITFSART